MVERKVFGSGHERNTLIPKVLKSFHGVLDQIEGFALLCFALLCLGGGQGLSGLGTSHRGLFLPGRELKNPCQWMSVVFLVYRRIGFAPYPKRSKYGQ